MTRKKKPIHVLNVHETPLLDFLNSDSEEEIIEAVIVAASRVARNNTLCDDGRHQPMREVTIPTMDKLKYELKRLEARRKLDQTFRVKP